MSEFWTKESVYDEKIRPLMEQILEVCEAEKIPVAAIFQYENNSEKGAGFCTSVVIHDDVPGVDETMYRAARVMMPKEGGDRTCEPS